MERVGWRLAVVLVVFGALAAVAPAAVQARSGGIYSWDPEVTAPFRCTQCHTPQLPPVPILTLTANNLSAAPVRVRAGQPVTLKIKLTVDNADNRTSAGMNIRVTDANGAAVSDVGLSVAGETQLVATTSNGRREITHTARNTITNRVRTWTVSWAAPSTCAVERRINVWVNLVGPGAAVREGDQPVNQVIRLLTYCPQDAGASCTIAGECTSGICLSGVCCGSACPPAAHASCTLPSSCELGTGICRTQCGATAAGTTCTSSMQCSSKNCLGGICCSGTCPATAPRVCYSQAHCQAASGTCVGERPVAQGGACEDGNANTVGDSCNGQGTCVGGASAPVRLYSWGNIHHGDGQAPALRLSPTPIPTTTSPPFKKIARGDHHSAALAVDGSVWVWGANDYGQLGLGDTAARSTPTKITQHVVLFTDVVAGGHHTVALTADGEVWAWGWGTVRPPAPASSSASPVIPRPIPFPTGVDRVIAIASGNDHAVALLSNGRVWELRDTSGALPSWVQVVGLGHVIAVAAGYRFTLALRASGDVASWGVNGVGQLGHGTTSASESTPTLVRDLFNVVAIAAGTQHGLALKSTGTVVAWGSNRFQQLGGPGPDWNVPVAVGATARFISIAAGASHNLALTATGDVWAWGINLSGQLGFDTGTALVGAPRKLAGLAMVGEISAGAFGSAALVATGRVLAWGRNSSRELGTTAVGAFTSAPVNSSAPSAIKQVASYCGTTYVLRANGEVWAWGVNSAGETGALSGATIANAVKVPGLPPIRAIAAGCNAGYALTDGGEVYSWGSNSNGQLGRADIPVGTGNHSPARMQLAGAVRAVSAGRYHALVLRDDGSVMLFGRSGDGANVPATGQRRTFGSPVRAAVGGDRFHLVLLSDGRLRAWGSNEFGQIGSCNGNDSELPVVVNRADLGAAIDESHWRGIAAGAAHGIALFGEGKTYTWGWGLPGQLGRNGSQCSVLPAPLGGPDNSLGAYIIGGGYAHTAVLHPDGSMYAVGENRDGQLGNGATVSTSTKQKVTGNHKFSGLAVGRYHTLGLSP
jgi:alpha-tubulin suppressor-like RCC1 family protein